jgi:biopolymer transport protein ExbD
MHHRFGHADTVDTEPDLTAMLDMVMQLLMFFIICAGVIKSERNEDVKLPDSSEAHLIAAVDRDSIFLNLIPFNREDMARRVTGKDQEEKLRVINNLFPNEGDTCILIPGETYPLRTIELEPWLKKRSEELLSGSKDGQIHSVIVMRADKSLDYAIVFRLLKLCKTMGFHDLKLRALTSAK